MVEDGPRFSPLDPRPLNRAILFPSDGLRGSQAPELPALPQWSIRLSVRHLDADHSPGMAGSASDKLRLSGGASNRSGIFADSAVVFIWRCGGRPGKQAPL